MDWFFKFHYPSKHYALIISEEDDKYSFGIISHDEKSKSRSNLKLNCNPNPLDESVAYIQKYIRTQPIKNFSKRIANHLFLSQQDKDMITKFLETKKTNKEQTEANEPERER